MPFKKGEKRVLTNESKADLKLLFFEIDFVEVEKPEKDLLYFHADWSRHPSSSIGSDVGLLPAVAWRGRFLGVIVRMQVKPPHGNSLWGEDDVKLYFNVAMTVPTI